MRWKLREFIFQKLRHFGGTLALGRDHSLGLLREYLVGKFTKPCFKHGSDYVDVIEFRFLEKIDIKL